MDTILICLCVSACAVTSASTALPGNCIANGYMEGLDCNAQAENYSNDVASGSQLMQLWRSTSLSQITDMDSDAPPIVKGTAISSVTEPWSGYASRGWLKRFPKLEAAINGKTHAQACVQIWKALGENSWMQYIDGRAHAGGPRVFDMAKPASHANRAVGSESSQHQATVRDEFSEEHSWESRWSVEKLATLNSVILGVQCVQPPCIDMVDDSGQSTNIDASAKLAWLTKILKQYYSAIDAIPVESSDMDGGSHISQALIHIAVLYHKLALLHPFCDGNSRTRLMVLQTELVRQGGHPTVLWDNYWGIYNMPHSPRFDADPNKMDKYNLSAVRAQLKEYVLDGWCGWEIVYNTGASPFSPFVDVNGTLASTPHSHYNAETGSCEEGPGRSYWEVPFDPNHPDEVKYGFMSLPKSA
jgi:hypothetical protein